MEFEGSCHEIWLILCLFSHPHVSSYFLCLGITGQLCQELIRFSTLCNDSHGSLVILVH